MHGDRVFEVWQAILVGWQTYFKAKFVIMSFIGYLIDARRRRRKKAS